MITFNNIGYMGRLGNQMFQFATTLATAERKNLTARFPIDNCSTPQPTGPFDYSVGSNIEVKCDLLNCFNIDNEYFIPSRAITSSYVYHEIDFKYNNQILAIPDNCTLHGYFQSEKYFIDYRDLILSQFNFKTSHKELATEYIDNIRELNDGYNITSVHVRRGDYLTSSEHHPPCSIEYYNRAADEILKYNKNKFIVFSDDPDWCRNTFMSDDYIVSDLNNPYIELCAMSLCDNHIIANSSFSWWGAWLNTNINKTVIAPSRWFGPALIKDTSDVYCGDWIIL